MLALSTVALAAGLALGAGALAPATALAQENRGAAPDGAVRAQVIIGAYPTWDECNYARWTSQLRGWRTTPCFKDPQGWFYQYFT